LQRRQFAPKLSWFADGRHSLHWRELLLEPGAMNSIDCFHENFARLLHCGAEHAKRDSSKMAVPFGRRLRRSPRNNARGERLFLPG